MNTLMDSSADALLPSTERARAGAITIRVRGGLHRERSLSDATHVDARRWLAVVALLFAVQACIATGRAATSTTAGEVARVGQLPVQGNNAAPRGPELGVAESIHLALVRAGSVFVREGSGDAARCEERLVAQALPWPTDSARNESPLALFLLAPPRVGEDGETTWIYWSVELADTGIHLVGWSRVTVDSANTPIRAAGAGAVMTYRQPRVTPTGIASRPDDGEAWLELADRPPLQTHWWFQHLDCQRALVSEPSSDDT
jgi:hypothetical protein